MINNKKDLIFEKPNTVGNSFTFWTKIFNGTNKFHMAFCILISILVVHFFTYLYFEMWPSVQTIWRFPLEVGIGYIIGFIVFSYLKVKNEITLHNDKLIFKNISGQHEINITDIDSIAYNTIPVLTATGIHFFSYYLYAQVKGKNIRLHKGYITESMANHLIRRINLGK